MKLIHLFLLISIWCLTSAAGESVEEKSLSERLVEWSQRALYHLSRDLEYQCSSYQPSFGAYDYNRCCDFYHSGVYDTSHCCPSNSFHSDRCCDPTGFYDRERCCESYDTYDYAQCWQREPSCLSWNPAVSHFDYDRCCDPWGYYNTNYCCDYHFDSDWCCEVGCHYDTSRCCDIYDGHYFDAGECEHHDLHTWTCEDWNPYSGGYDYSNCCDPYGYYDSSQCCQTHFDSFHCCDTYGYYDVDRCCDLHGAYYDVNRCPQRQPTCADWDPSYQSYDYNRCCDPNGYYDSVQCCSTHFSQYHCCDVSGYYDRDRCCDSSGQYYSPRLCPNTCESWYRSSNTPYNYDACCDPYGHYDADYCCSHSFDEYHCCSSNGHFDTGRCCNAHGPYYDAQRCPQPEPVCTNWDNHIKLKHQQDRCLEYNPSDQYVYLTHCSLTDPFQQWFRDGQSLRSINDPSLCITYDIRGDRKWLYVTECSGRINQLWALGQYRIHPVNYGDRKCMDTCDTCGGYVYVEACEDRRNEDQKFVPGSCVFEEKG